jgi:predicted unusual protein kinase regulating ubiquinone biosynthesis (AarF/ABC1/UbiB family)
LRLRRSLLTQEGICMQLQPNFHFLEVAYPYIARRLLTDEDPALRERLFQVCSFVASEKQLCLFFT